MVKKIYYEFLVLVLLVSSLYIMLPEQIRIDVQKTKSIYSVYENHQFVPAAREFVNLFDGTAKMRASSRSLDHIEVDGIITIVRIANYKDEIVTRETYIFDSGISDIRKVPVSHETICINCVGKILQFEYRDILYEGETKDIESPFKFGRNMELTWQSGTYRSIVYQQKSSDKIILRYRPTEDYQVFNVRLFDPPNTSYSGINVTILFPINNTLYVANELDLNWTVNITANASYYSLDEGSNNSDIFVGGPVNVTFSNLTEGNHNITIYVNDSDGNLAQSDFLNFSIRPPLNVVLHSNLTSLGYSVNWSKTNINYSGPEFWGGNFSWNFTDLDLNISPILPYVYNITNTRINNVTVYLNIDRDEDYFNWTYNETVINTTSQGLFNLSPNQSILINFSLDLINISRVYVGWNITIDRANWSFTPNFTDRILI